MSNVKIITDSCADLTGEQLAKYDVDYVKMSTILDGEERPALLTWTADEVHDFYEKMRAGVQFKTAQVPVEEFRTVFGKYLEEGRDIVYIACSVKQTGSINTGFVTAKQLLESYPDRKIICIDSLNASIGEGMLAMKAAEKAREGTSAEEIEEYILSIRKTVNEYATVHSLDALKRAGRVKASAAFLGNLMGVKPILVADAEGYQAAYKKVKGRQKSLNEIVTLLKSSIIDAENQTVYLLHADCDADEVRALAETVRSEIPCRDVKIGFIGPIIGASVGPDTIGVWAFGESVTFSAGV